MPPDSRAVRIICPMVLFAAVILNYRPWRGYRPDWHVDFGTEPVRIARNIVEHGEFANPFAALPTGKTAHIAPVLPFILYVVLGTGGERGTSALIIQSLPIFSLGLELALLPWVGELLGFSFWTGMGAGVLGIVSKPDAAPEWEAHLAGLLCVLAVGAFRQWRQKPCTSRALPAGLLAGALFQVQPVCAVPWLVAVVLAPVRTPRIIGDAGILLITPILVCMPWILRNYVQVGAPVIRDNIGIELYVSFNDCAQATFQENLDHSCIERFHPNSSVTEALDIIRLGEIEYNRQRLRTAMLWIEGHRRSSVKLVVQRFFLFWFPASEGTAASWLRHPRYLARPFTTVAFLFGLYLCCKQHYPSRTVFLVWLSLFPIIYYIVQSAPRYSYPILWICWILAAHATGYMRREIAYWGRAVT